MRLALVETDPRQTARGPRLDSGRVGSRGVTQGAGNVARGIYLPGVNLVHRRQIFLPGPASERNLEGPPHKAVTGAHQSRYRKSSSISSTKHHPQSSPGSSERMIACLV
jgi:hypothetical protein